MLYEDEIDKPKEDHQAELKKRAAAQDEDSRSVTRRSFHDEDGQDEEQADEDQDEEKVRYQERLENIIKADEKIKKAKMDKDEKMRRTIEAEIKEEQRQKAVKDEEQKRLKRLGSEERQKEKRTDAKGTRT